MKPGSIAWPDAVLSCMQCLALWNLCFTIAGASRVLKTHGKGEASKLSMLLQQGRKLKDYSRLMAYLKGLTPSRLDSELRFMQVCLCSWEDVSCGCACLHAAVQMPVAVLHCELCSMHGHNPLRLMRHQCFLARMPLYLKHTQQDRNLIVGRHMVLRPGMSLCSGRTIC